MQNDLPRRVPGAGPKTVADDKPERSQADAPLTVSQRTRLAALLRPIGAKPGGED